MFAFADTFVLLKIAHTPVSCDLFRMPIVLPDVRELKTHLGGWE